MSRPALAIDLGTTTLAVSLIDTVSGERLALAGAMNPQRPFGADVVSRLDAAVNSPDALSEMSRLVREELLRLACVVCQQAALPFEQIGRIALAGNPAMQHILLNLPVKSLAFPPYRPLQTGGMMLTAEELGWPGDARIYVFPMPGGFVGGDTVAFLHGQLERFPADAPPAFFLDMGTNGEMALAAGDTIWCTSAAAGPAFEGGNLSCGMCALPGAISSVRFEAERIRLTVIGEVPAAGICGSAAIEALHGLRRLGIVTATGRLLDPPQIESNLANRVVTHNGENAFVLQRDARRLLLLTQSDIRQVQLAKGAIRVGMEVLAQRSQTPLEHLQDVVLTGSFGAVLKPEWLETLGIFDSAMACRSRFSPEGALGGAEKALCAADGFAAVEELAGRMRVVPLSGTPAFEGLFLKHIDFPDLDNNTST